MLRHPTGKCNTLGNVFNQPTPSFGWPFLLWWHVASFSCSSGPAGLPAAAPPVICHTLDNALNPIFLFRSTPFVVLARCVAVCFFQDLLAILPRLLVLMLQAANRHLKSSRAVASWRHRTLLTSETCLHTRGSWLASGTL